MMSKALGCQQLPCCFQQNLCWEIAVFLMSFTAEVLPATFPITLAGGPRGSCSTEEHKSRHEKGLLQLDHSPAKFAVLRIIGKLWLSKSHSGCLSYKGCIHLPQTRECHIGNPEMSCPVFWCCIRRTTRLLWAPLVCQAHADVWTFAKHMKQQNIDILSVSELCLDGGWVKEDCTVVTSAVSVSAVEKWLSLQCFGEEYFSLLVVINLY